MLASIMGQSEAGTSNCAKWGLYEVSMCWRDASFQTAVTRRKT